MTTNITTAEDCLAQLGIKLPDAPEPFCGSRADVQSAYSAILREIGADLRSERVRETPTVNGENIRIDGGHMQAPGVNNKRTQTKKEGST